MVEVYPDAQYLPSPEQVRVTVPLESGDYSRTSAPVAVLIPPGYRATGPDGFLVPSDLAFANGEAMPVSEGSALGLAGWHLVSFHHIDDAGTSTWRPTADPTRGDNLVGYLASIEAFLARRCM